MEPTRTHVRVPVGALIPIAPHGAGTTSVLTAKLTDAGLAPNRVISTAALRTRFSGRCANLGHRVVPASCDHHDSEVTQISTALAATLRAGGHTHLIDAPLPTLEDLREQVTRAHQAGLAAVALRRTNSTGDGDIHLEQCMAWNAGRNGRTPEQAVIDSHTRYLATTHDQLRALGFDVVIDWNQDTTFELMPESVDARHVSTTGAVVVGDLHGCARTFFDRLLPAIGTDAQLSNPDVLLISVGDIHDKGADPAGSVELIRWWLWALKSGRALMSDSNHNRKLVKALTGRQQRIGHALAATLAEIDAQDDAHKLRADIIATFGRLPNHLWFDDLVVTHAAMREDLLGSDDPKTASFTLWARKATTPWQWTGTQTLVHGHVVVDAVDRTREPADPDRPGHQPGEVINVDTGAYRGGGMSAYLHDSRTTLTVPTHTSDALDEVTLAAHLHTIAQRT